MKRSPQTFQQNDINKHLCSNVNSTKFFKQDNFCLFINPCSLRDQVIYGSRLRLVNTKDGIQLELNRKTLGSGSLKCHIFIIVITCSMTIECYSLQPKYMLCSSMDLGNILFNALIVEPTNWGMMQFLVNQNWGSLRTADIFLVVPPKNDIFGGMTGNTSAVCRLELRPLLWQVWLCCTHLPNIHLKPLDHFAERDLQSSASSTGLHFDWKW